MGGMLSRTPHDPNQEPPVTAAIGAPTDRTVLTDISFKAGFHSLSLDDVIKITGLPLETNEEAMKMMIESKKHTWKDKKLTQAFQEYFTVTSNLLLWTKNDEQNEVGIMKSDLERFIPQSQSFERQLRDHYAKINGRKKKKYLLLQVVASIFSMIPLIGPLNVGLFGGKNGVSTVTSILLSFGFLATGAVGSGALWFLKRKRNALEVQEELIGPLLMSMVFRNKDLNRISLFLNDGRTREDPDFNAAISKLEESLWSDRNLIQQKLSEQMKSTSPEFSIRWDGLDADYSRSDRTMY